MENNQLNSLVIGSTSQLSYYFPEEYERISSRNINLQNYANKKYNRIFLTFAEQDIENKSINDFINTNVNLTLYLINFFSNKANYIIIYGSCELWNNYNGAIDINDKFNFNINSFYYKYCLSKQQLIESIKKNNFKNVIVIHPFNFNSPYRKSYFLFNKIFYSIINKKSIEIGNTYFYRDMIHPKYVVERSILSTHDELVGSGRLIFVNDFIKELYKKNQLKYNKYVNENLSLSRNDNIIYLKSKEIKYKNLLEDTLIDINNFKI